MRQDDWNRRYAESGLLWSAEPNRFLAAETAELPPGRALDLACGEGRSAVWLAERGWQATGVDFSDVALAKARDLAEKRGVQVELVHADLLDYRPPERAFDLVCILYLHLPEEERRLVLGRAAAAVAPGGTLLLVGHDTSNLEEGTGGPSDARVLYTPDEIATDLQGLEIEKAARVLRPVDGAERPAIDALVLATRPRE
jgi:SAM-dependent methyltransferase